MLVIIAILLLFLYAILGFKKPGIAFVTSPFVCFFLVCAAFLQEGPEIALFAPVIFFATLVAVLLGSEPDFERWPQKWAKLILISFAFLPLFAIAFFLFGSAGSVGFGLFILFIGAIISYGLTSRHATAAYVISTIGSSMRQNLPLPMALESAAGGRGDRRSIILRRIQKWLVQGYSLSESIKRGFPKCPGFAVAMIAAAERIDQLPFAIKSIEADMVAKADESRKIRPVHLFYPVILIVFTSFMLWAVMTFVIPRFGAVLDEMVERAQLPAATRFLMHIVGYVAYEIGAVLWGILAFIVIVVVPLSIRIKFRPRRPQRPYLVSRIADFIKWHLPVLHWFEKNYSMVQVVELLRLSLNSGCTVNGAITNTLGLDVNNRFRKRLQRWLAKVERGDNIAAAVRESRLGNSLAWAFDEKVNQGNTLTILEALESFYRSNYSYRVNLARFIMWPCVTIIMGLMVGFVAYAVFIPMVKIVSALAESVTP